MRVLLAFDKFKDALSARAATETAAATLRERHPDWQLDLCPLTDGGEGFCETLCAGRAERIEHLTVRGPRGGSVVAPVGFVPAASLPKSVRERLNLASTQTLAVAGLASASGLELLPRNRRDPWQTTTFGTGELLGYAAHEKAGAILLGLGGSATNDLGLGALTALGAKSYDVRGVLIPQPTPANWEPLHRLDLTGLRRLPPLFLACDVTNPLLGPHGATATFGPQKGLLPADFPRLEAAAARMANLLGTTAAQPSTLTDTPGAGAAGGIAFGLMAAAHAHIVSGFDLVSDWLNLPQRLAAADLIITGEGRFDASSLGGKGPGSLVRAAAALGKPVHVFAGRVAAPPAPGAQYHAITPAGRPLAEALPRTAEFLRAALLRTL